MVEEFNLEDYVETYGYTLDEARKIIIAHGMSPDDFVREGRVFSLARAIVNERKKMQLDEIEL